MTSLTQSSREFENENDSLDFPGGITISRVADQKFHLNLLTHTMKAGNSKSEARYLLDGKELLPEVDIYEYWS